jgi:hypothetical protein
MKRERLVFLAWILTGAAIIGLLNFDSGIQRAAAGLLLIGWGLVIATNFHGAADAMHAGMPRLWRGTTRRSIRLGFAWFGFCGLVLFIAIVAQAI